MSTLDLTLTEQKHVRTMIRVLYLRYGSWDALTRALHFKGDTVKKALSGHDTVSTNIAFRVARLADVSIDDLLAGRAVPDGTCPHCGHRPDFTDEMTVVETVDG